MCQLTAISPMTSCTRLCQYITWHDVLKERTIEYHWRASDMFIVALPSLMLRSTRSCVRHSQPCPLWPSGSTHKELVCHRVDVLVKLLDCGGIEGRVHDATKLRVWLVFAARQVEHTRSLPGAAMYGAAMYSQQGHDTVALEGAETKVEVSLLPTAFGAAERQGQFASMAT